MAAMVETPSGDEAAGKPWVWFDDRKAARDATNYLLGLGHKTVHYVSIPSSTSTSQRMLGWRSALEDAGVSVPKPLQAGWDPQSSSQAAQHRLTRDRKVTAVLCGNDDLAIGVMRAMHQAGRAIPDDVSIVGFDDTPLAAFYIPALTTVRQDFAALGKACFAKLLSLLDANASQDAHPWPQAELIVRESAGPPPLPRQRANGQSGSVRAGTGAGGRPRRAPGTRSPAPAPAASSGVGPEQTRKTAKGVSR
jgi:DNA-binding LacI/PurR family transcriptional regulator